MQIVGRLLEDSGGVVMGVATEDEFVDAIQAGEDVALSGCFINGSGKMCHDLSLSSTLFYHMTLCTVQVKKWCLHENGDFY